MATVDNKLEKDLVHLARVALSGRPQDVMALLHRFAKAYRDNAPTMASSIADLLRESPTRASPLRRQTEAILPVDADTRFHLLRIEEHPVLDHEPVYSDTVKAALDALVAERKGLESLQRAGLEPSRTVLFTGDPGVGKTLAARWLARELDRPLLILDLAAVMSSYLGRTGTNLRHVLDYAKTIDCVLLLDELDAIAKRRDDRGEIGELKRLVTVLIQQIDDWPSRGLLVSATNHPDLLDPAIWRRFDLTLEFPLPDRKATYAYLLSALGPISSSPESWARTLAIAFEGQSFSDIDREIRAVRRKSALSGEPLDDQFAGLINGKSVSKSDRIAIAAELVSAGVMSQRAAHEVTGVARDTIRAHAVKKPAKSSARGQDG